MIPEQIQCIPIWHSWNSAIAVRNRNNRSAVSINLISINSIQCYRLNLGRFSRSFFISYMAAAIAKKNNNQPLFKASHN